MRIVISMVVGLVVVLSTGCGTPSAMEKAALGRYEMRADRDLLDDVFAEHVYFTREAASGGRGVGGGGCGCN
jgi:hypothetical protein